MRCIKIDLWALSNSMSSKTKSYVAGVKNRQRDKELKETFGNQNLDNEVDPDKPTKVIK